MGGLSRYTVSLCQIPPKVCGFRLKFFDFDDLGKVLKARKEGIKA